MPFEAEIKTAADKNKIPYQLLYAQVSQESSFNPHACSKCGARGLLQLEPVTCREMGLKDDDVFDISKNLDAGTGYLRRKYKEMFHFLNTLPQTNSKGMPVNVIANEDEYWKLALASYNGGAGYVIKAINLCIQDGLSIRWANISLMLGDPRCQCKGNHPDYKQMRNYVEEIFTNFKAAVGDADGTKEA